MKLAIIHYHLRPGGIRRIVELATPHLVRQLGAQRVVLAVGEAADRSWNEQFVAALRPVPVEFCVVPALGYSSEWRRGTASLRQAVREGLEQVLAGATPEDTAVWAHNLGVGRNPWLASELARACAARGLPWISHHHDWWFDNRWQRWPELRQAGFRTLRAAATAVFPDGPEVRHAAINAADAALLQTRGGRRSAWLPNLAERPAPPDPRRVRAARRWLDRQLGSEGPVWLLPCRLLRRKNVAEALLLTRWLRPGAWLAMTGGVSSADEAPYARRLEGAAGRHGWPLRLGLLAGAGSEAPSVAELMAASEAVLLTSIQEGFGLPYVEAVAAGRPLLARSLPNIAPDLARFGFRFPQVYDELRVATGLFDGAAERRRQAAWFRAWRAQLPRACRRWAEEPPVLQGPTNAVWVPFSRLTLTAQLEVLAHPAEASWAACRAANPCLVEWETRATRGRLRCATWPRTAERWLGGRGYARRWIELLARRGPARVGSAPASQVQEAFIRARLRAAYQYPLLWRQAT